MAVLEKKKNQKSQEIEILDVDVLQKFQDQFCKANHVYLSCFSIQDGVVTKSHGSEEEKSFLHQKIGEGTYMTLLKRAKDVSLENVLEEETSYPYLKLCSVAAHVGDVKIVWLVTAVLEEAIGEEDNIPDSMMRTTETRLYHSLEFLEYLSLVLFAVKMDEMIAQEAMQNSAKSEESMRVQLKRSESMTKIVNMLESDLSFGKVVDDILKLVCTCLDISHGALIRENRDAETVDMICEYALDPAWYCLAGYQNRPKSEIPFFNGRPYMISSDSLYPDEFRDYLEKYKTTAAIYQPIEINGNTAMYLCFSIMDGSRVWSVSDIKFINDVKRIIQSILTKRITKNSLTSSYASLEAILENTGCGIYVVDQKSKSVLYTNQKFKDLFENTIVSGKLDVLLFSEKELNSKNYFEEVYFSEENKWMDMHKCEIEWVDGRKVSLCTAYDITDKKLYQKRIETQANNDFLTGLYNRMRCEQDLEHFIRMAEINESEGALLYIDLDDFKHINDGLGHQYGDILLKAVSRSLQKISGIESTCYRMGGDEFVVIVTDASKKRLEGIYREIQAVFTKPWLLKGEDYYCTASMGVACFPTDGNTVDDLIRKADMALYAAKRDGKNRLEFYNSSDAMVTHKRLDLEKNMRKAILDQCSEFEVYYQPIFDTSKADGGCCGAEALVRWNSIEMGFMAPVDFIPLAEYLGLINPIGDFVLYQAAKRCRYWNDMGHPGYKVNVNLSVVQLLQTDIVDKIRDVIEETRVDPKNLVLEVTESLAVNDMDRMKLILSQIKELGVKVALDDFGNGYSSLNRIRELPIDTIKIDRGFVSHLAQDDFSQAFVKMVGELAQTLGLEVCAEGVEAREQTEIISDMKIRYLQGYYFDKPMQVADFEKKYI